MKKRRIILGFLVGLLLLTNRIYAKYQYSIEENIIELTRDTNPPVCTVSYSKEEITNENVCITITADKEVEQPSGFELSANRKVLTKEVTENETGIVKVRDLFGNISDVEYEVTNIDKEPPQIIGCEDGKTYQSPLVLEYYDNMEIKDIAVEQYSDQFIASFHEIYYDSYWYRGIDRTSTTLTVQIDAHPKGTKKYQYYLGEDLYATTTETHYTFTGLEKGKEYPIKIYALDELGNRLETVEMLGRTSYYSAIEGTKTNEKFSAIFKQLDNSVAQIEYAVWNDYKKEDVIWQTVLPENGEATIACNSVSSRLYPSYTIHAYLYDANHEILDVIGFSIDFGTNYEKKTNEINVNELEENRKLSNLCTRFGR